MANPLSWFRDEGQPDLHRSGVAFATRNDLATTPAHAGAALQAARDRAAVASLAVGERYQADEEERAAEHGEIQADYDDAAIDLEHDAAAAQAAQADWELIEAEARKQQEIDENSGHTNLARRVQLPERAHLWYSLVAFPGELIFTILLFNSYQGATVGLGTFHLNLAWLTAVTVCAVLYAASFVAGIMWARLTKGRAARADLEARRLLAVSLGTGLLMSFGLSALRVQFAWTEYHRLIGLIADQGFSTGIDVPPPDSLALFTTYLVVYLGLFGMSAIVAALSWDPIARERRRVLDAPMDAYRAAVDGFLGAETALRAIWRQAAVRWNAATDEDDRIWQQLQAEVGPYFAGLEAGNRGPLPADWAALRNTVVRGPVPRWREHPPTEEPRFLPEERRARVLRMVELADLPPHRPADRFRGDDPGAGAQPPHVPDPCPPPGPEPDPFPPPFDRVVVADGPGGDLAAPFYDAVGPPPAGPAGPPPVIPEPPVDDAPAPPAEPPAPTPERVEGVMDLDDDPLGLAG